LQPQNSPARFVGIGVSLGDLITASFESAGLNGSDA